MTRRAKHEPERTLAADIATRLVSGCHEQPVLQTVLAVVAQGGLEHPVPVSTLLTYTPLVDQHPAEDQTSSRETLIQRSIETAVEAGLLAMVDSEPGAETRIAVVTTGDRRSWTSGISPAAESGNDEQRPNVFELYEQQIGLITPIIADKIGQALDLYPDGWVEEAIDEASAYNRRNWRYIETILENWTTEGRCRETNQRDHEEHLDPGKYLHGRYAPYFRKR